jgi:hypothetical protein
MSPGPLADSSEPPLLEPPLPEPTTPGTPNLPYRPAESPRSCASDPSPRLTHHITDLTRIEFIAPTIVASGNWLKNRSYLVIAQDSTDQPVEIPVYAPVDSKLTGLTYYAQPMADRQGGWRDVPQYDLRFQVSCEVSYGFDHLERLAEPLASLAPLAPASDTRNAQKPVDLELRGGQLIGYTTGTILAHSWDFILSNSSREPIQFANPGRYAGEGDLQRLRFADCPYQYYSEEMAQEYYSRFGGLNATGMATGTELDCDLEPDQLGSLSGGWFREVFSDNSGGGPGVGWGLTVVREADGNIAINGEGTGIRTSPDSPTYADPKEVTGEHCYEHYSHPPRYAYLSLISDTEVAVVFGEGSCPPQMPAGSETFYR